MGDDDLEGPGVDELLEDPTSHRHVGQVDHVVAVDMGDEDRGQVGLFNACLSEPQYSPAAGVDVV